MGAGAAVTILGLRGARAGLTLTGAAALVGLAAVAVAHSWLGVITGDWWTEAGVIALTVLAIGAAVAGLASLLGPRGLGVSALLMILLGNSFSGVTSAPSCSPNRSACSGSGCRRARAAHCCARSRSSTAARRAALSSRSHSGRRSV